MTTVRFRQSTIILISVVVVLAPVLAFVIAHLLPDQEQELSTTLQRAGITLAFGGIFGVLAKMLLDDFDRYRQQRADRAQFITNVLADLKSAHDRVERVRILLPAHESALTLGDEMQEVIEAHVQLKDVRRALERDPYRSIGGLGEVRNQVVCMQEYLSTLIHALQKEYRPIADLERIHESLVKAVLEGSEKQTVERLKSLEKQTLERRKKQSVQGELEKNTAAENSEWPANTPWEALCSICEVEGFIGDQYESKFVGCLDEASCRLRKELRNLLR